MELFVKIIMAALLTAIIYMFLPIFCLVFGRKRYEERIAHKIALWNSVMVGLICCIITIELYEFNVSWNAGPAVMYYWINRFMLTINNKNKTKVDNRLYSVKYKTCAKCDSKLPNDSEFCQYCGNKLE